METANARTIRKLIVNSLVKTAGSNGNAELKPVVLGYHASTVYPIEMGSLISI